MVVIYNPANVERLGYVRFCVDDDEVSDLDLERAVVLKVLHDIGDVYRSTVAAAYIGKVGLRSREFVAAVPLGRHQRVHGVLTQQWDKKPASPVEFKLHPGVADDLNELMPRFALDGSSSRQASRSLTLVSASALHQEWRLAMSWGSWRVVWHVTAYSGHPVLDVNYALTWCPNEEGPTTHVAPGPAGLWTRELFLNWFGAKHGEQPPSARPDGWYVNHLGNDLEFAWGSSIWGMGQMLCQFPEWMEDPDIRAAMQGLPVMAVGSEWPEPMWAERLANNQAIEDGIAADAGRFYADLRRPGDRYAQPMLGSNRHPGSPGGQEDFGYLAGGRVFAPAQPDMLLPLLEGALGDLHRPCALVKPTGEVVSRQDNPALHDSVWGRVVIWSGVPLFEESLSPNQFRRTKDALGRRRWVNSGWLQYDDQHMALGDLAAALTLTNNPLLRDLAKNHLLLSQYKHKRRLGAPRAMGRLIGSYADMYQATGDEAWVDLIEEKVQTIHDLCHTLHVAGPVKVLEWRGPDLRKQVYDPETGQLGDWWSPWEHGLFMVGGYKAEAALLHAKRGVAVALLLGIMETVAGTMVNFAIRRHGGQWLVVDDMLYRPDGADPGYPVTLESRHAVVNLGPRGVGNWTVAGLMACREYVAGTKASKLNDFLTTIPAPTTIDDAEWLAAGDPLPHWGLGR